MRALRALMHRLGGLRASGRVEQEFGEELEHDLQCMVRDGVERGLPPEEARRRALLRLGGLEQTRQAMRERRSLPMLETIWKDLKFAARQLRLRPGFAVTAVITLALGLSASIAIFSFVYAALLRPLPYAKPAQLVWTTEVVERMGPANLSWQDYEDWQRGATSFSSFAVWRYDGHLLRSGDRLLQTPAMRVSANFLHTLGVKPALGRDFEAKDNAKGAAPVVMLSHGVWERQFGGRQEIVGQIVRLDDQPYQVAGVLPEDFAYAPRGRVDLLTALRPEGCEARRSCHSLNGVARLKDGATVAAADAEVKRIAATLEREYPDSNRGQGAMAAPLAEEAVGKVRPVLYTLLTAAMLLFAIACINVANLLLARTEGRRREIALRGALGASRGRLLRQFCVESAILVAVGLLAGVLGAFAGTHMLLALMPEDMRAQMQFLADVRMGGPVLLFAAGEALLATMLFSLTPVLRVQFARVRAGLSESTSGGGSLSWRRLGSQLVVLEVATAVVLLVGAGLLTKSLLRLLQVNLAFDPEHLLTLSVFAPSANFKTDAEQFAVQKAVVDRIGTMPGVQNVGMGSMLPVTYNGNTDWIRFVGRPYDGHHIEINERSASPEYFRVLRVKLLRGRLFTDDDDKDKPRVVIVNRSFAEQYFPGVDPIGKQFGDTELTPKSMRQIVGVVDDLHEGALDDAVWPAEYESMAQAIDNNAVVVARVSGAERPMLLEVAKAARGVSADLGISDEVTMADRIHDSQSATLHRGAAWLAGSFALLALLLCAIGLYGVVMYSVSLRTRELGVRMALGSSRGAIYELVLREAGVLTAVGVGLGLALAVATANLLRTMLYGVRSWDLPTLLGVTIVLTAASLVASFFPAHRAATVDPARALRTE